MNCKKEINNFVVTDVVDNDDELTIFGEGDIYAKTSLNDVLYHHPGATGYTADRYCDRANDYHVPSEDLWKDGSDAGHPVNMVVEVWDKISKDWYDENDELIIKK